MASTQIQTTGTNAEPASNAKAIVKAGSRLWAIVSAASGSDTGVNLWYSDNDGGSWNKPTGGDLDTTANNFGVAIDARQVAGTWELHCSWAAGNATTTFALKHADILSNVDTGTPGTITVNTVDAGGTNAGVLFPSLVITPTGSNPRVWILAAKVTASGPTVENRLWRAPTTTASPTWTTHNDINSTSASTGSATIVNSYGGSLVYWSVSAANKLTVVCKKRVGTTYDAFTFDPSAGSPALGSATNFSSGSFDTSAEQAGPLCCIAATADYLIFGRNTTNAAATWNFYKTVNGTSWTTPTGWTTLTMGRASLATDGTNFWLLHTASWGDPSNTAQALKYRQITVSGDTMGGVNNFSDQNGNPVSVPRDTGTSNLYSIYRASTTSPYSMRSDFVNIGAAADTTPPGSASATATANTAGARIDLSATMPPDADVAQYEIRVLTTGSPASNRSDGTVIVSPTATSANAVVTFNHTSLTNGTRYYYRVFVSDVSGNWNTGTAVTNVAHTRPTFLGRYRSDGVTAVADGVTAGGNNMILEFQLASANFEAGKVAHFRLISGTDQANPPTTGTNAYTSYAGDGTFKYEEPAASGSFSAVPTSGLDTSFFGRKLRAYTQESASSRWLSLGVEQ